MPHNNLLCILHLQGAQMTVPLGMTESLITTTIPAQRSQQSNKGGWDQR